MPKEITRESGLTLRLNEIRKDWVDWNYQSQAGWKASGLIHPAEDRDGWVITGQPEVPGLVALREEYATLQSTVRLLEQIIGYAEERSRNLNQEITDMFG